MHRLTTRIHRLERWLPPSRETIRIPESSRQAFRHLVSLAHADHPEMALMTDPQEHLEALTRWLDGGSRHA